MTEYRQLSHTTLQSSSVFLLSCAVLQIFLSASFLLYSYHWLPSFTVCVNLDHNEMLSLIVFVSWCGFMHRWVQVSSESRRKHGIPWMWGYRHLWPGCPEMERTTQLLSLSPALHLIFMSPSWSLKRGLTICSYISITRITCFLITMWYITDIFWFFLIG